MIVRALSDRHGLLRALLTLTMLATLAGCGNRALAGDTMTLEFWDFPHLPKTSEYIQRAIARFEQENPGVRIRYTRLPWQDGQQKVALSVNAGRPPDVCGQVNVSPQFIAQDVLEPLNDYLADDITDIYPSYLDAVTYRGRIYALPWYKACYVMLLNLDLFEQFGVEPPRNGRWTWDEFLEKMRRLTTNRDGRQYYGLVTNLGPVEYEAYSVIFNFGGRVLVKDANGLVNSGVVKTGFAEGLRRLVALEYEHHVAMPGIGAMTQEQSWNVWRDSRTCAASFQGAWCITAVQVANEAVERTNARKMASGRADETIKPVRWMIAAPPSDGETTPVLGSSGLGTYVVFKQKDPRKRDLAVKFIKALTTGEGQTILKHENVYPSRRSTGNLWAHDPMLGPVFELFPDGVMSPLVPGTERVDKVLQQEVQKALLRDPKTGRPQVTPEQAVKTADEKIRAILDRARRRFESAP